MNSSNAEQSPQMGAYLEIDSIGRFVISETATIGRAQGCDIVVNAASVSRQHAQIFLEGDRFWIKDLGSSNGVYVNDSKATLQELSDGDVVLFGEVRSMFRISTQSIESIEQSTTQTQIGVVDDVESPASTAVEAELRRKIQNLEAENQRLKKLVTQLERVLADSNLRIRNLQERLEKS
jgi:pSer/pThr/pTyr-binding forkhead associated (FHA) protein